MFDILDEQMDVDYQIKKINELLSENSVGNWTLEEVIDAYCLKDWKVILKIRELFY